VVRDTSNHLFFIECYAGLRFYDFDYAERACLKLVIVKDQKVSTELLFARFEKIFILYQSLVAFQPGLESFYAARLQVLEVHTLQPLGRLTQ